MTKALITNTRGSFTLEDIVVGGPGADEVSVKIMASGICHTDYDSMRWADPIVMGHEGAGVVTAIGDQVTSVKAGDRVLLNWAIPCGACFQCQRGEEAICEVNSPVTSGNVGIGPGHAHGEATTLNGKIIQRSFNLGTMSQQTVVKEAAVVKIDIDIPFASACIIGCGVMTGYGSVHNVAQVEPGSHCVILGAGGVGLNVIQGCRIAKAGQVIAIDVNESRLKMARQFGATHTLLATRDDTGLLKAAEQVRQLTEGRGADYCFECTAIPELGAAPLAMVRNAGTALQVSGIEQEITIDMNLFEWDKIYMNPLYGKCRPQVDLPKILAHYSAGEILLDELVTKTYAIEELGKAFEDMHSGAIAKGVILMDSGYN